MQGVSFSSSSYDWAPALDDNHDGRMTEPEWSDMRPQDATQVLECSVAYSDKQSASTCKSRFGMVESGGWLHATLEPVSPPEQELSVEQGASFAASLLDKQLAHVFNNAAGRMPAHKAELSPALYVALETKGRNAAAVFATGLSTTVKDAQKFATDFLGTEESARQTHLQKNVANAQGWISALEPAQRAKVEQELTKNHPEVAKLLVATR